MPVIEINTQETKFEYLQYLLDHREQLISEMQSMPLDREHITHYSVPNWSLSFLYVATIGRTKNIKYFPTVSKFIDTLPDNLRFCFIQISSICHGDTRFHKEKWTKEKGYYRFHVPLDNVEGASIIVDEPNEGKVTYTYELGKVYRFENAYNSHKPSNFNSKGTTRSIIMMDIVDINENPKLNDKKLFDKYVGAHGEFTANSLIL